MLGGEAQLSADRLAVEAGMEAQDVGARVDDLDLLGRHPGRDQIALDRLADRDDRVNAPARVADPPHPGHVEADAAIQDELRPRAHEPGEQRERARPSLVRVSHLDLAGADHLRQTPRRAHVPGALHRDRDVADAGRGHPLGPELARRCRDRHGVAAGGQADREIPQLDRCAGEVVRLGVELQDPERGLDGGEPRVLRLAKR